MDVLTMAVVMVIAMMAVVIIAVIDMEILRGA